MAQIDGLKSEVGGNPSLVDAQHAAEKQLGHEWLQERNNLERALETAKSVKDSAEVERLSSLIKNHADSLETLPARAQEAALKSLDRVAAAREVLVQHIEHLAKGGEGPGSAQLFDQSFQEYKKVFDQFPDSGRVGEAVAKMANYYYVQKDYARAIDVFETVLRTHPDAKFLDVILFNYGRCLYRLDKKAEARKQFDQMIADFPESPLAPDAKKISEALRKAGN